MSTHQYSALKDTDSLELELSSSRPPKRRLCSVSRTFFCLSLLLNLVFCARWSQIVSFGCQSLAQSSFPHNGQLTYSPAESAITYKQVRFSVGFGNKSSIYEKPPSPEVDKAWKDLWHYSIAQVPREIALQLENKTLPVSTELGKDGHYVVSPDMFHALHCLDYLRMNIYRSHYDDSQFAYGHLEHCLGHVRQSIMCSGDVSTNVYQWSKKHGHAVLRSDVSHTCRDFDKLRDWVKDHWYPDFDELHLKQDVNDSLTT